MRKKRRGLSSEESLIFRRLEDCNLTNSFRVDQVVSELKAKHRDYDRKKLQPFTKSVERALELYRRRSIAAASTSNEEDDSANSSPFTPLRKKKKIDNDKEERLLRTEAEYLRRKQNRKPNGLSSSSSSAASSDGEDGSGSTSEDAIFESKVDLDIDLMKSMIRENYKASNSKGKEKKLVVREEKRCSDSKKGEEEEEKNMEVEDCNKEKKIAIGRDEMEKGKLTTDLKGREICEEKGGPRFKDLGGIKGVLDELIMEVIFPLCHPQLLLRLGVKPMSGILLHGPPGCGKTKLAHAIANETGVPFYKISATEVVSGISGASEENIRDLFTKAHRTAPSIVFIDEIDAIASKRESLQREMERRIVTQLMTCMDESHQTKGAADSDSDTEASDQKPGYVLVIGATNRPDAVDPAIRRPGRFDREIVLGVPDENARIEILSVLTRKLRLEGTFDLGKIARCTPGFVGADLTALANKAGNLAMKRIIDRRKHELAGEPRNEEQKEEWWKRPWVDEEMESLSITMVDFEEAAKIVQPSTRREGFSTIPNVKWEDVGGLDLLRKEFDRYIVSRIKHPEDYEEFGVDLETGFLLYGPPGCGKTLIAKAVANEAGANFIHIKGPELLNKYVGESELAVRTIFNRARTCSPCILFFDEVDAITRTRGEEGGWVVERLFTQLLIELDGADKRRGVFVIGATNRPEVMDPAVKRPGRFGKLLYVPLPGPDERGLILKALARKKPMDEDVDLIGIGKKESCEHLSGADLAAVLNEAAMVALEEKQMLGRDGLDKKTWTIKEAHLERALEKISPSVSNQQRIHYKGLTQRYTTA